MVLTCVELREPRSYPFGVLQPFLCAVGNAGVLSKCVSWVRFFRSIFVTYLLAGESLARKVVAASGEALLDNVSVHLQEILHLVTLQSEWWSRVKNTAHTCFFSMILVIWACSAELKLEKSMIEIYGVGSKVEDERVQVERRDDETKRVVTCSDQISREWKESPCLLHDIDTSHKMIFSSPNTSTRIRRSSLHISLRIGPKDPH
jgi:hypothetical protein